MIKIVSIICLISLVIAGVIFMCLRIASSVARQGGGNWRIAFGMSQLASILMSILYLVITLDGLSKYSIGLVDSAIPALLGVVGLFFWVVMMYLVHYKYALTEGRV